MNQVFIDPSEPFRLPLEPVNPVVDLCFPIIQGPALEIDHGQALHQALGARCAGLARIPGLGIHAVRGTPGPVKGELELTGESEVRLRLPAGSAGLLTELAGAELELAGHRIRLGEPCVHALTPVSALWARTVTIHFRDLAIGAAQAQLAFRLARDCPWGSFRILRPRTIRFEGRQLLGFELAVRNLAPQASLLLQAQGFGGRRALGCGLFVPFAASARSKAIAS
jgi:CRISPR-associated protein Cas6